MIIQVIYQIKNGPKGEWLDYCREQGPYPMDLDKSLGRTNRWAIEWCDRLERETNRPIRYKIELWH
jgi:hypothetical protein